MTHKTLEKFEAKAPHVKSNLDYLKKVLHRYRANENELCATETKHEIYGTINTLFYLDIITERERQILYIYYTM